MHTRTSCSSTLMRSWPSGIWHACLLSHARSPHWLAHTCAHARTRRHNKRVDTRARTHADTRAKHTHTQRERERDTHTSMQVLRALLMSLCCSLLLPLLRHAIAPAGARHPVPTDTRHAAAADAHLCDGGPHAGPGPAARRQPQLRAGQASTVRGGCQLLRTARARPCVCVCVCVRARVRACRCVFDRDVRCCARLPARLRVPAWHAHIRPRCRACARLQQPSPARALVAPAAAWTPAGGWTRARVGCRRPPAAGHVRARAVLLV
jgi:hypothetical protein